MRWRGNSPVFNSDKSIIPILLEFRWQDEPHRLQWTCKVRRISLWLWPTCRPVKLLFWPSKLLCNNFCGHNITSYPPISKTQNPTQNSTVLYYEGLSWLLYNHYKWRGVRLELRPGPLDSGILRHPRHGYTGQHQRPLDHYRWYVFTFCRGCP